MKDKETLQQTCVALVNELRRKRRKYCRAHDAIAKEQTKIKELEETIAALEAAIKSIQLEIKSFRGFGV